MHYLSALVFGLTLTIAQPTPAAEVDKVETREFLMPLEIDPGAASKIKSILLYVSDDDGKIWSLHSKYKPTDKEMRFVAITEGEYWFALQILFADGKLVPAEEKELSVARKVLVGKKVPPPPPTTPASDTTDKLAKELDALRTTLANLKERPAAPVQIPADVEEVNHLTISLPLILDPGADKQFKQIKLHVSDDLGKTWSLAKSYKPVKQDMEYKAPRDGIYWFALQFEDKDGKLVPTKADTFRPSAKIYVNTGRALVNGNANLDELRQEIADLRKSVDALMKKVSQLEKQKH